MATSPNRSAIRDQLAAVSAIRALIQKTALDLRDLGSLRSQSIHRRPPGTGSLQLTRLRTGLIVAHQRDFVFDYPAAPVLRVPVELTQTLQLHRVIGD